MTGPVSDSAFQHAHDALIGQSDFQFAFPGYTQPPVPGWVVALGHFLRDNWHAIKIGLWVVAGLILCLFIYALVRRFWPLLWTMQAPGRAERTQSEWRPSAAAARELLRESDALAAEGRYSEAVHLLLLRSIQDIEERRPHLVRPALTSREIGVLGALPENARAAFAPIVRLVERALFAGEPLGADDFARCRRDYESFAFARAWSAAT